jgi:hypothetical protein
VTFPFTGIDVNHAVAHELVFHHTKVKFDLVAVYGASVSVVQLITFIDHVVVVHQLAVALNVTVAQSKHSSPLAMYPFSQLHFAYKLAGAVDHVVTAVVRAALEYHHWKTELSLFGVQSDLILFASTIIIASVHHFESIVIEG